VLSLIDAATGGKFDATHPLWPSVMKLKQRKVIVQAGTRPPFKFYLSDPFFAAVVGAQQSNTIVPTLVAQLRGRGLESLLNPMLPAILKDHGLGHLVRPRLALFPPSIIIFPSPCSLSGATVSIRSIRGRSSVLQGT
jgi:hypothetical protein